MNLRHRNQQKIFIKFLKREKSSNITLAKLKNSPYLDLRMVTAIFSISIPEDAPSTRIAPTHAEIIHRLAHERAIVPINQKVKSLEIFLIEPFTNSAN